MFKAILGSSRFARDTNQPVTSHYVIGGLRQTEGSRTVGKRIKTGRRERRI